MADDCRKDIIEVVRDAARELTDHLHLCRLCDLPFELGLLAIVLEQEKDGGITETAKARNSKRDGFRRLIAKANGQVA
jgi:hypothetical protein